MIKRIKSTQPIDILEIRWAMSNMCNFKCSYCFPGSNEGNHLYPSNLDTVINNFVHLFDNYKQTHKKKRFDLKILGGEPTLWKNLPKFIESIKQKHDVRVSIISNGSRTLRWWEEHGHLIDNLILSFHQEYADINHTISVADIMYKMNKNITVHVLMDDRLWDECEASIQYMKDNSKYRWVIQAKEIVPTYKRQINYSEQQREYLKKEYKRFPNLLWIIKNISSFFDGTIRPYESEYITTEGYRYKAGPQYYLTSKQNIFKGWDCSIGLESLYIDYTGILMGSCGQYFLQEKSNILDENFIDIFSVPLSPVTCKIDKCDCPHETHISKINFYF